jgi:PTS system beta-glucosides-specific IIC component
MDYLKTAQEIVQSVGGAENIEHVEHCSTRLRLSLYDNDKVDKRALEKVPGVLGVRLNVQCQVVIGREVIAIFEAVQQQVSAAEPSESSASFNLWCPRLPVAGC